MTLTALLTRLASLSRFGGARDASLLPMIAAMGAVARSDGPHAEPEVATLVAVIHRVTGRSVPADRVQDLLRSEDGGLTPEAVWQMAADLPPRDRQRVLEAALSLAVADGAIAPARYSVIHELATRLAIGAEEFDAVLSRIASRLQPQPA